MSRYGQTLVFVELEPCEPAHPPLPRVSIIFKKTDVLYEEINNFIKTCLGKEKSMTTGYSGEEALIVAKKITRNF